MIGSRHASVAQLVEQLIRNEQVIGSIPITGSIHFIMRRLVILIAFPFSLIASNAPKAPDQRIDIELIAEAPDIVTPTGLGVDAKGRISVIESHTHFRP